MSESEANSAQARAALARRERIGAVARTAGAIAHELSNQLTVLLGTLDLAMLEADRGARDTLAGVRRAGERITKLVHALERLSSTRTPLLRPVDLVAEVRVVVDRFDGRLDTDADLSLVCARDTLPVDTDPDLVYEALVNVLANAVRAVGEAGEIEIAVDADDAQWRITVSDNGSGVDPAVAGREFDPLATTRRMPGAGLGLSHALLALAALGGDVSLESERGKGTRVRLTAPRRAASGPVESRTPPVLVRGAGRILVVDDSPVTLMEAHSILAGAGYDVTMARGHGRALDRLTAGLRPDLVLTETVLYDGGATELLDWLAQREQHTPLIGVVFAGDASPADAARMAAVVTKPFDAHSLTAAVAEALAATR